MTPKNVRRFGTEKDSIQALLDSTELWNSEVESTKAGLATFEIVSHPDGSFGWRVTIPYGKDHSSDFPFPTRSAAKQNAQKHLRERLKELMASEKPSQSSDR